MSRFLATLLSLLFAFSLPADPLNPDWCRRYGDSTADVLVALDIGAEDRIHLTGDFQGAIDFGGEQLYSQGEYDIFLAAIDPTGSHVWSRSFGDFSNDKVRDLVVDDEGNVIIVGDFFTNLDLGGGELSSAGDKDIFIAKYNGNGHHLWSARFGDAYYQSAQCVAVDGEGRIYLAGPFNGTLNLGGEDLTTFEGQRLFLACLDASGDHLWSQMFLGMGDQWVHDLNLAAGFDLAMAGSFEGYLEIGGEYLISQGGLDAYLLVFGPVTGALSWAESYGSSGDQEARAVARYDSGDLVLGGDFEDMLVLGDDSHYSQGSYDLFLARLDADGEFLWSRSDGNSYVQLAEEVSVGPYGDIAFTGVAAGDMDFGGGLIYADSGFNAFLATFGPVGEHRTSWLYGESSEQRGIDLAWDSEGWLHWGAWFFGGMDLHTCGFMNSVGSADIALVKFQRDATDSPPPAEAAFLNAHPNPFNPSTEISFALDFPSEVTLAIYDSAGRHLRILLDSARREAGEHRVIWDGRDAKGQALPSGIYLCKLKAGKQFETLTLVLLK